jgi:hypothetical protein
MLQVAGYTSPERKDRRVNCSCIDQTEAMWDREPPSGLETGFTAGPSANGRSPDPEHLPRIRVRCLYCGRIWVE